MRVVCAWCQKAGNFVVLREKEPAGDEISHGICDEHVRAVLAEARPQPLDDQRAAGRRPADRQHERSALIASEVRRPVSGRLLVIVSRDAPGRFVYLKYLYASETVDVIVDRRVRERRRRPQLAVNERRWQSRRRRDVTEELGNFGWTLVRR